MTDLSGEIQSFIDEHEGVSGSIEAELNEALPVEATVVRVDTEPTSGDRLCVDIEFEGLGEEIDEAFDDFEVGGAPGVTVYVPCDDR